MLLSLSRDFHRLFWLQILVQIHLNLQENLVSYFDIPYYTGTEGWEKKVFTAKQTCISFALLAYKFVFLFLDFSAFLGLSLVKDWISGWFYVLL